MKEVGTTVIHDIQAYSKRHLVTKPHPSLLVKADRELDKLGTKSERKRTLAAHRAQDFYMEYVTGVAPDLDALGCALVLAEITGDKDADEARASRIAEFIVEERARGYDFADSDAMAKLFSEAGIECEWES